MLPARRLELVPSTPVFVFPAVRGRNSISNSLIFAPAACAFFINSASSSHWREERVRFAKSRFFMPFKPDCGSDAGRESNPFPMIWEKPKERKRRVENSEVSRFVTTKSASFRALAIFGMSSGRYCKSASRKIMPLAFAFEKPRRNAMPLPFGASSNSMFLWVFAKLSTSSRVLSALPPSTTMNWNDLEFFNLRRRRNNSGMFWPSSRVGMITDRIGFCKAYAPLDWKMVPRA